MRRERDEIKVKMVMDHLKIMNWIKVLTVAILIARKYKKDQQTEIFNGAVSSLLKEL